MRCALRSLLATALAIMASGPNVPVLADCDAMGHGINDSVQGYTWIGRFEERLGKEGDATTWDHWTVEKVIAGDVPTDLSYHPFTPQNGCHPVEFKRGVRYLVSTSDLEFPSNKNTVGYRLLEHGRVRLVPFLTRAEFYDDRYRVTTLTAALRLVAPGALPQTDTIGPVTDAGAASAQEQPAGGVVGRVVVLVAEALKEAMQRLELLVRHLDAQEHPAVVGAVVAIVEQTDVPAGAHALQEVEERP